MAAAVVVAGLSASCTEPPVARPAAADIRIATGDPGGVLFPLGKALAKLYSHSIPGLHLSVDPRGGSTVHLRAVNDGLAELAFARADVAYSAYTQGRPRDPGPYRKLRGVAVLYPSVLHVIVKGDSPFRRPRSLRGGRVAYGWQRGGPPPPMTLTLLSVGGELDLDDVFGVGMSFEEVVRAVGSGDVEGGLILSGYPLSVLAEITHETRLRLLEIDADVAARIRAQHPFYKQAWIPADTYEGQTEPVRTIGVDNVLLCREDLDDDIAYALTRVLFENLSGLAQSNTQMLRVNPERASATPLPLHPGAARYFRERELLR